MKSKIIFFTDEEYDSLKYKHLKRSDYKNFIKSCNERIAKELVVMRRGGWEMPFNLGKLQIFKNFNIKGTVNSITKEVYRNYHSMGYIYKCRYYRGGNRIYYNSSFSSIKNRMSLVDTTFYRFINHRHNINRYITKVIKGNLMDYDIKHKNDKCL